MRLENAINYRLVSQIAGVSVAERWGYNNNSAGYKETQRIFKSKFSFIDLEEFKDEIILAWRAESANKENYKMTMSQVLEEEESNEENRAIFNKICEKVKIQSKENLLTGIPKEIKENKEIINNSIEIIDNGFSKLIQAAKNNKFKLNFAKEEYLDIMSALSYIDVMKDKNALEGLDSDTFLESILKVYNKKNNEAEIPLKNYTEQMLVEIKADFNARLNGIAVNKKDTNTRKRTKETIFDKIDSSKISVMSISDFSMGYDELIELYDAIDNNLYNIDELVKFYNIEGRYNLLFYINIVIDLFEDTTLTRRELAKQISKLALVDCYIYRPSNMKLVINKIIYAYNKEPEVFMKLCDEISQLIVLKNRIVRDLIEVGTLVYKELKEEAFNSISVKSKKEILNQLEKIDVVYYLGFQGDKKNTQKLLKNLKYLMENNKEVLLGRSTFKNII